MARNFLFFFTPAFYPGIIMNCVLIDPGWQIKAKRLLLANWNILYRQARM